MVEQSCMCPVHPLQGLLLSAPENLVSAEERSICSKTLHVLEKAASLHVLGPTAGKNLPMSKHAA